MSAYHERLYEWELRRWVFVVRVQGRFNGLRMTGRKVVRISVGDYKLFSRRSLNWEVKK